MQVDCNFFRLTRRFTGPGFTDPVYHQDRGANGRCTVRRVGSRWVATLERDGQTHTCADRSIRGAADDVCRKYFTAQRERGHG